MIIESLKDAIFSICILTFRKLIIMDRLFLVFQILTPVILTYFMGYSFGSYISNINGIPYPIYLASGMIVFNAIFTSQWLGHGIWDERKNGMYTQLRVMGFSEYHYLVSSLLYNLIFALFSMIVILIAYPELILKLSAISIPYILSAFTLLVAFYGSISMIISLISKDQVTFVLINTAIFEISAFTSSALYPPSHDISIVTALNPLSYIVDIMRIALFGLDSEKIGIEMSIIIILGLCMIVLARKIISKTSE
ncbi:MAG TPA: ABC transporter permease [Nitrososphaeraceae archaeon]|nr:ABC transporter permease [Nitrososphaeraceae archaeon]